MLKTVIFDDAPIVTKGLQEMIDWSKHGMEIVGTATDGTSALQMMKEKHPDIMLTDIRMPGLDGLELIEYVMDIAPKTICVVFTGFKEYDYVKKALKLGVIDYLEKPITIEKMEESITKILNKIEEEKRYHEVEEAQMDDHDSLTSITKLNSHHPSINQAVEFIYHNYDKPITLKEVAEHVDMNATYFSHLFKEEVGLSYIKYVTEVRMEKAKDMLRKGEKVTEVSEKVGYYTYRHFSDVFKKKVGMSPGQYKEK
ncbi:response regulator [Gracilibacillus sp. YIM 98692]|uniref:response regulator transcription factor n=1 Tax=Gracilibacillus sp. YIM 98692 TaxID=2663532 RepID=UPI0013D6E6D7|nr:response regulator [Gracilibacillus sp. YIM 98692]